MEKNDKVPSAGSPGGATNESANDDNLPAINSERNLFMQMALEMSWQLAVVVLLPLIGGIVLDGKLHTSPYLTFAGLFLAFAGTFGVLYRMMHEANRRVSAADRTKAGQ